MNKLFKEQIKQMASKYAESLEQSFSVCHTIARANITISADNVASDIDMDLAMLPTPAAQLVVAMVSRATVSFCDFVSLCIKNSDDPKEIYTFVASIDDGHKFIFTTSLDEEENDKKYRRILMDNELSMLYKHEDKEFALQCLREKYTATHSSGILWCIDYLTNKI